MTVINVGSSVNVSVATRSNPTFLNWGYSIFSINQRSYDRMNLDVSAQLRSGRVTGQPWVNHTTPKSHMRNTCKGLPEEERKAALEYAKAMEDVDRVLFSAEAYFMSNDYNYSISLPNGYDLRGIPIDFTDGSRLCRSYDCF